MSYNGGSVVAMVGKDCVAIASDMRLGQQAIGVAHNFEKVCSPGPLADARSSPSTTSCTTVSQVLPRTSTHCEHQAVSD